VANLAETVDADIEDIAAGMGMDSRIGSRFLHAGLGYGGSCFPKDVAAFHWVAQQQGVDFQLLRRFAGSTTPEGDLFQQGARCVVDTARQAAGRPGPGLQGRYGRHSRSPAIDVIKKLLEAGTLITAYDPAAMERAREVLPPSRN